MSPVVIDEDGPVIHPSLVRGPIESHFNGLRDARETQFNEDLTELKVAFQKDVSRISGEKAEALVAAGLNADGSTPLGWNKTSAGAFPAAPFNVSPPVITGTKTVGEVLTTSDGNWTNTPDPDAFEYQWQRATYGALPQNIPGETENTYTLTETDEDWKICVIVTARNQGGSASAVSELTSVIQPAE